jgi:hypothetical protein
MEQNKQQEKKDFTISTSFVTSTIGALDKVLTMVKEYGIVRILTTTFLIAFISIFFFFVLNPNKVFEFYDEWKIRQHDKLMEMRMDNTPKIQSLVDKLTYKVDASRTLLLELHNGNTGNGGFPFTKCSATFEGLNVGVHPISDQYQNNNLSLIPFSTFIFERGFWCGNTDELMAIDKALCYRLKSNKTEHFAACVVEGIDKELAIIFVSFDKVPDEQHNCQFVRENLRHIAMEIAILLEVEKRVAERM